MLPVVMNKMLRKKTKKAALLHTNLKIVTMLRLFIIAFMVISCNQETAFDEQKERTAILKLQQQQRENHFRKNAAQMVSPSDSFYVIDHGSIHHPKKEEQLKTFTDYFNSVDFVRWDDKREPIIRFSKDGSMAYGAIEKLVVLKVKDSNGKDVLDTTHFAWMSVYRKEKGQWIMDAIASTNK